MGYSKIQTNSISIKPSIQNSISLKNVNLISEGNDIFSYPIRDSDDLSVIKFNGQLPYNSIVPHKHGEDSLSCTVFASGFVSNDVAPYKAFTYNTTDKWQVDTITGIIGYEFTEPKLIYKYEISCHSLTNINRAPKTWTFEGYNEDTYLWDVLDTQTDIVLTATDFSRTILINNPTTKYAKYRLNITVNNGNATSLSINHIKLYEIYDKLDMSNKIRIELDERTKLYLYKITNGVCDIYEQTSVYDFIIPNTNNEYFIYFYLNDNGSIVFEGNDLYNFKTNSFPICSIFNNSANKIINFNKLNKFNYSVIYNIFRLKTPKPIAAGENPSVEGYDTFIYCVGGHGGNDYTNYVAYSDNQEYNTQSDTWISKSNCTISGGARAHCAINNTFYFIAGRTGSKSTGDYYYCSYKTNNIIYDTINDTWANKTVFPVATGETQGRNVNNNIYVINGRTNTNTTSYSNTVSFHHYYNIDDDVWSTKINKTTENRFFAVENYQNDIYCIGGAYPNANVNERYNTLEDTWGTKLNLITGNMFSTKINDVKMYCFPLYGYTMYIYNILLDTWTTYEKQSPVYFNNKAVTVNNSIYILGSTLHAVQFIPQASN